MLNHPFQLTELTRLDDPLLPAWLDLYETSFIPQERLLVSYYLRLLKEKDRPENQRIHLLAAVDASGFLGGIIHYFDAGPARVAALWYLAVHPSLRGKGLGSELYRALLQRLDPAATDLLLFEVEIPQLQPTSKEAELARRRIGFYQRLGAQLLDGIDYLQVIGSHQPPLPMHVMVHRFIPLSPQQVYDRAKQIYADNLNRRGEVALLPRDQPSLPSTQT